MESAQETKAYEIKPGPDDLPAAVMPSVPGHDVQEMVGRGGMGKVYRAKQTELGRTVAVKLLAHEPDEQSLARFREECRAVARLQHSNIAQLYESGLYEGRPFFTQEFLGGGSLADKFNGQPQDPKESARIVEIVARAIHFSHQQGILHRDLKPGNVLLSADGTPKVTDFGLAKEIANPNADTPLESSGLTRTGEILGTPSYMAPEQASGVVSKLGPPADIYSLGAILYEALTGRPPFQAPDALQTLFMVLSMEPVSPRVLLPRLPRDIETICLKCLEKTPRRRYASALALAEDLQRFQRGEPIVARPVGKIEQYIKWSKRNKAAAALIAVSVVFFFAMLGAATSVIIGNMRLQKANKDLVDAKTDIENKNKDLEAAKNESDKSFLLARQTVDGTARRLSIRLYGIPKAEAVLLDSYQASADFYEELVAVRPNDESTAISYGESLITLSEAFESYAKRQQAEDAALKLERFLKEQEAKFPNNARLQALKVRLAMGRKQIAEKGEDAPLIKRLREQFVASVDSYSARFPDTFDTFIFRINRHTTLGNLKWSANDKLGRIAECQKAVELAESYYKTYPEERVLNTLRGAIMELGLVEEICDNLFVARKAYQRGVEVTQEALNRASNKQSYIPGLVDMKVNVARLTLKLRQNEEALELFQETEKYQRELVRSFPLDPYKKCELAENLYYQAVILHEDNKQAAIKAIREAYGLVEPLAKAAPDIVQFTWTRDQYLKLLNRLEGKK